MIIIDGKKIRDEILEKVKAEVALLPFVPVFCDVLVGEDPVSMQYVRMKNRTALSVGLKFYNAIFPVSISTEDLIIEIKKLNQMPDMCGIIVQLPLSKSIDIEAVLNIIDPNLDVDCLGETTKNKFYQNESFLCSPAALACMVLLDSLNLDLRSKNIVVLGQGELVGRPVSRLFQFRGLNPEVLASQSENKKELIKNADIIISGIGHGKFITGDMIKEGAIIIDAGTTEFGGGVVGDVDLDSVREVAGFVSPVPGGVGPVTVAMLLNNVLQVAKSKIN